MTKRSAIILFCIVFSAFLLRVNGISENPPSMSWDEVSIGYNAYSILKTGADEHGRVFPLDAFKAYGDYKPPIPVYLTVPFVFLFGLSEYAVRLPVALMGTVSVFLSYFFASFLFRIFPIRSKDGQNLRYAGDIGLTVAALLAVSPWHINLSRAGFEAVTAHTFLLAGCVLVLQSLNRPRWWSVAFLPFVACVYTFNSARYAVPLILAGLLFLFKKKIAGSYKKIAAGFLVCLVLLLPIIPHLVSPEARLRFAEVSIFTDATVVEKANQRISADGGVWWSKFLNNRRVGFARSYLTHFADNLEPGFLFITGDGNPKFSIRDVGQMYLAEAPFLIAGIIALLASRPQIGIFLLFFIVAAIAPAAVARETPHALRTLNTLPAWQIFTAVGLVEAAVYMKRFRKGVRLAAYILLFLTSVFSVGYYLHTYYVHYPVTYSGEWQYGYREAVRYAAPKMADYETVTMTESIGRPYMYALFYTAYDPASFVRGKQSYTDAAGFYHVDGFDKFRFTKKLDRNVPATGRHLVIGDPAWVAEDDTVLETVRLLNGTPVLVIFEI
jgi:hypothetical protein